MDHEFAVRELGRAELTRVGEIDRHERIASPWEREGDGAHSVAAQVRALERCPASM